MCLDVEGCLAVSLQYLLLKWLAACLFIFSMPCLPAMHTALATTENTTHRSLNSPFIFPLSSSPPLKSAAEDEEAAPGAFVMRELLKEEAPFHMLLQTGQVLLAQGQHGEARELLQAALDVCGRR
jgi:hypothetical protein